MLFYNCILNLYYYYYYYYYFFTIYVYYYFFIILKAPQLKRGQGWLRADGRPYRGGRAGKQVQDGSRKETFWHLQVAGSRLRPPPGSGPAPARPGPARHRPPLGSGPGPDRPTWPRPGPAGSGPAGPGAVGHGPAPARPGPATAGARWIRRSNAACATTSSGNASLPCTGVRKSSAPRL